MASNGFRVEGKLGYLKTILKLGCTSIMYVYLRRVNVMLFNIFGPKLAILTQITAVKG
jgi:hypothetical protein